jgi:tetratricopeptide (TPR) repeat protein
MKIKDIYKDSKADIYKVTDQEHENELEWTIIPTDLKVIPEDEEMYFVKAKEVHANKTVDCFLGVMTPERIAETVIKLKGDKIVVEEIYDLPYSVIPAVASDCHGDYELYYAKENPQIGIDILKDGLTHSKTKNVIAQDLGYILRDENRAEEAIEAFKISESVGPSSEYTFLELSRLYKELGQKDKQIEYEEKFKNAGGRPSH